MSNQSNFELDHQPFPPAVKGGMVLFVVFVIGMIGYFFDEYDNNTVHVTVAEEPATPTPTVSPTQTPIPTYTPQPSIAEVVANVIDSVVLIEVNNGVSNGTGVIYQQDGFLVTNAHVVENAEIITVYHSGKEYDADLMGMSVCDDLAVLKINSTDALPTVSYQIPLEVQLGDEVISLGYESISSITRPITPSVHYGIISRLGISYGSLKDVIQHQAPLNPGDSGGPLFDRSGQWIGINTQRLIDDYAQGLYFAINLDYAIPILKRLENQEALELEPLKTQEAIEAYMAALGERHCWAIVLDAQHLVCIEVISLFSPDQEIWLDPELWIFNPRNEPVYYVDDIGIANTATIQVDDWQPVESGLYQFVIGSTGHSPSGDYTLRVYQPVFNTDCEFINS